MLLGLGRVPGNVGGFAVEKIRHEDSVLVVLVGVGEQVGALECLCEEAEDVVDDQDALACRRRAGGVCKEKE